MGGNGGKGAGGWNANYQSSTDDSSFLSLLRTMDEQDDSSSLQKAIFQTKCQPGLNQQQVIEIVDEEADNNDNGGVGPSPPVIRNALNVEIREAQEYLDSDEQMITLGPEDSLDLIRTLRMGSYGLLISGPSLHLWFNFVSEVFPKKDVVNTFKKMFLGQAV